MAKSYKSLLGLALKIRISGRDYDIPYGNVVSFTNKRFMSNVGNQFNLVILGPLSLDIETAILTGDKKITLSYGWERDHDMRVFTGSVYEVDVKFEDMRIALSISGVVDIGYQDQTRYNRVFSKGTTFASIMSVMYRAHPEWAQGGVLADAEPLSKDITQSNMSDSKFLSEVLSQVLVSKNEELSLYKLWFTDKGGKSVLNYAPQKYMYNQEKPDDNHIYTLFSKGDTSLISFEFSNMGGLTYVAGDTVTSEFIDSNGNFKQEKVTNTLMRNKYDSFPRSSFSNPGVSTSIISSDNAIANAMTKAYWQSMFETQFEATAEILGDPHLDVGDLVRIEVFLENGVLHYTSGDYSVLEIEDRMDTSGFTSSMKLCRYSTDIGDV